MGRYFLSHTMRVSALSVLVVCVSSAPQWDGLKSLVKNLSGDDKPGEVNGDYEQVPYEVLAKANGYEERKYPSVMYACTEMTYDTPDDEEGEEWSLERVMEGEAAEQDVHETLQIHRWCEQGEPGDRDDGPSVEQDGRLSGGRKDYQRHVLLYYQRIPIKSSRAYRPRGEDSQEQGEDRVRQAVWWLRHAGLRLDEGGREVQGGAGREGRRGGAELLLDGGLRQSHEVLEQEE